MSYVPENPLIVQSDHTLLLETMGPHFETVRDLLARFAELLKSPEYVHTWRISPLSLWNAAAAGVTSDEVTGALERWSKYDVPANVLVQIRERMGRYGRLTLRPFDERSLLLEAADEALMLELRHTKPLQPMLGLALSETRSLVDAGRRGEIKQALIRAGHPVDDQVGYVDGDALEVALRPATLGEGAPLSLRGYQTEAVDAFLGGGRHEGGSGVVVLPCGAGKTLVGIGAMARLQTRTLILCANTTALRQWRAEILDKTTLTEDDVGEYSGNVKQLRPVTLTTYQLLTWRRSQHATFEHFSIFRRARWGLVIYDEVHLLPAPIFRAAAELQARRRLGLTATLVREDGNEVDVFSLIGPKRFDMPWKELEHQGWIAAARCQEIRVALSEQDRLRYATSDARARFRLAATNARKLPVVQALLEAHPDAQTLILGTYVEQLQWLARRLKIPLLTGRTRQAERDAIFADFRAGRARVLAISRVGNFSVDLPQASVAIQISGTWGSRQEEAQRLGRVLRPKRDGGEAWFYTLVSRDTIEQDYAERRQLFLTEQGYAYRIAFEAPSGTP